MPKLCHEALVQIVRNAPELVARLVCPEDEAVVTSVRVTTPEFVDLNLPEYRADAVLVKGEDPERPVRAFVTEVQSAIDPRKHWTWPHYFTSLRPSRTRTISRVASSRRIRLRIASGVDAASVRPRPALVDRGSCAGKVVIVLG